ncbi:hypothetical protein JVT61DRAFT_10052 [Boletus reticuloceps]|uniref:Uncharacterized protein n=1 Tax=Boletus reticuloceps TaxID=495285 RepID=A0A8I3ABS2_9AGAM|nr:hypothetical protein JVT61DRAFT_10052 [Boletus reticuloceps]
MQTNGWNFTVLMGDPDPLDPEGGNLITSLHVGQTKDGQDFANMYPNFDTEVVQAYGEYLAEVFNNESAGDLKSEGTKQGEFDDESDGSNDDDDDDRGHGGNSSNAGNVSACIEPKKGEEGQGEGVDNAAEGAADVGGGSISSHHIVTDMQCFATFNNATSPIPYDAATFPANTGMPMPEATASPPHFAIPTLPLTTSPAHLATSLPHPTTPPHDLAISTQHFVTPPFPMNAGIPIPEATSSPTHFATHALPFATSSPAHLATLLPSMSLTNSTMGSDPYGATCSSFTDLLYDDTWSVSGFGNSWNGTLAPASLQGPTSSGAASLNYTFPTTSPMMSYPTIALCNDLTQGLG